MSTQATPPPDPLAMARSKAYVVLLVLAALIGIPISAFAYFFLALVEELQGWVYTDLPDALGAGADATWWPLIPLTVAGLLVGLVIRYLPGGGGESPADGFRAGRGPAHPRTLPGIFLAALAGLALGAVIGPEAPLIALGGGLAAAIVHLRRAQGPAGAQAGAVLGATGSFAAVSTLLGNPLVGAVLMLEASGLGGAMAGLVLVPGLLASGVGYLIFVGLDAITGLGTFSLALPDVGTLEAVEGSELIWAVGVGLAAAVLVFLIRSLALAIRPVVERRVVVMTTLAGLVVGGLAVLFAEWTDRPATDVLFSGQSALGPLVQNAATYSVGTLVLLMLVKALAYAVSLSAFRGGPVFPSMFVGAVGGLALSHLPGLSPITGIGIGIAAMTGAMLRLPVFAVLLTFVFLADAGPDLLPAVIIAVAVSYTASAWLRPRGVREEAPPAPAAAPRGSAST
ncbi:MAG: chloride channel protein [Thermoleophilia bacterium]|nr:chloride channel protein [Thermoleophilia bacterium]